MQSTDMSQRLQEDGRWETIRGHIREEWADLTDQELEHARGSWDMLVGTIKEKTGEAIEDIERKLKDWTN